MTLVNERIHIACKESAGKIWYICLELKDRFYLTATTPHRSSSEMWCPVVWQKFNDVSEKHTIFIFRIKKKAEQKYNQQAQFSVGCLGLHFDSENGGRKSLRSRLHGVIYQMIESSFPPSWGPQISYEEAVSALEIPGADRYITEHDRS